MPKRKPSEDSTLPLIGGSQRSYVGKATLERVLSDKGHGFRFLLLKIKGKKAVTAVLRNYPDDITEGDRFDIKGVFEANPKGKGENLVIHEISKAVPKTMSQVKRWLEAAQIPGVGPKTIEKIGDAIKDNWHSVVQNPEEMSARTGVYLEVCERISQKWMRDPERNELRAKLVGAGLSRRQTAEILVHFGEEAAEILSQNPWACMGVKGIGFANADLVAKAFDFPMDHPIRREVGLYQAMIDMVEATGSTRISQEVLLSRAHKMLKCPLVMVEESLDDILQREDGAIVLCEHSGLLAARSIMEVERNLARQILRFLAQGKPVTNSISDAISAIEIAERNTGVTLDRESGQFDAALRALTKPLSIITGGPGPGKSTVQSVICKAAEILMEGGNYSPDNPMLSLAAPTGRAAKRLSETSGKPATTLHRMLKLIPDENGQAEEFSRKPLGRLVLADELSMMGAWLSLKFFSRLKAGSAAVLVGDADQLPSVEYGDVLRDLIKSGIIETTVLTRVRRTANGVEISQAARNIMNGDHPVPEGQKLVGVHLVDVPDEKIPRAIETIMGGRVRNLGHDPFTEVQVMAAMKKDFVGVHALNNMIRDTLFPEERLSTDFCDDKYAVGDRVMALKNDAEREISNGMIGTVIRVHPEKQEVDINFSETEDSAHIISFGRHNSSEIMHARAATMHKMQGSECPCVILVLPKNHERMLSRELVYTALTRAKKDCIIIGERKTIAEACARSNASERISGLIYFLSENKKENKFQKQNRKIDPEPDLIAQKEFSLF